MKTLYLMRHARASKDMNGITDYDRPLLMEGIENTQKMTDHLKSLKITIKHIVTSPAKRAMKTATTVAHGYGIRREDILSYDELYKPDIPAFEDCIFSLPDDWDHVMLVSHNPGISDFADSLIRIEESMPTGSIISISFDMDRWINLYASPPLLNFFLQPKQINA
ncbi:MAG TPA: histidine phosphatase family protein [Lentimicrobium sp.]|nr:histidine phosphatase family protein [Lentimicrobium sp.]